MAGWNWQWSSYPYFRLSATHHSQGTKGTSEGARNSSVQAVYHNQTWGNYELVNYFLPISHYNWQLKVICPFNEYISFNSTSFDQLVSQLLLILLLLIHSNSNLMGLINYFLLVLIFWLLSLNLQSRTKILEAGKFLFSFWSFLRKTEKLIELLMGITNYFFKK